MESIALASTSLDAYRGLVRDELIADVERLARPLRGLRVVHLNATPTGGGVAEILRSLVPLMRGIGLRADWLVLSRDLAFFAVTKRLHNLLQGKPGELSSGEQEVFLRHNELMAAELARVVADVWVIHDPQPLPVIATHPNLHPSIWRCHIDTSTCSAAIRDFVLPFVTQYDRVVFTLPEYVFPELDREKTLFISPAIDPLVAKNIPVDREVARRLLHKLGIHPRRPLVTQVSRFDPWKDPMGVIDAYRRARQRVSDLQLAMVGVMAAQDDPEAVTVFDEVRRHAGSDADIHLYTQALQVGDIEVNAFQSASEVVVQKSIREGFGLTVTETMWKGLPVVGGRAGGVAVQIRDGETGFLVDSVEECADRIVLLLQDRDLAERLGRAAREHVRHHYLMPALLRDYLSTFQVLVGMRRAA
ncbi:MAG: glycosyltransferase [Chloroflexi bacterium]|nr:glycosyltransferase [Chloroflexota bacterium]